jgi:lipoprotein-anchoring transpeptidase ErfK/SrfK
MPIQLVLCILFVFLSTTISAGFLTNQSDVDAAFQNPNDFSPQENFRESYPKETYSYDASSYNYNLPARIATDEKVILVDPNVHAWGAYTANGKLIRAGRASAGAEWCDDIDRPCKTKSGVFRIYSLGDRDCVSSKYPINEGGGAPMPYCMYFNGAEGLHGSNHVVDDNISHGCVRLRVSDAEWLRHHFATKGTKVIIKHY